MTTSQSEPSDVATGRLPPLDPLQMTDEQKAVFEAIRTGPRGFVPPPLAVLLRSPELADHFQRMGAYMIYRCRLPSRLKEIAVLVTAHAFGAAYEADVHRKMALRAGLEPDIIAAIEEGREPVFVSDDERAVYDFAVHAHAHRGKVQKQEVFDAALARLGENGIVELTGVIAFYSMVATILNVLNSPVHAESYR